MIAGVLIGGALAASLGRVLALAAVITGLFTVAARSYAVLRSDPRLSSREFDRRLELATARGFVAGLGVSACVFALDALLGA